ncbi:DUF342 domain-containing protein [Vibrio sp. SM6]|uniref:DUF342 domain-containing protein n=1 Tax=Vibrio agarilyticus TaxID=2726741 RepID=A0A7X8TPP4_9VIBR|nr:FapA family protein [Vibrio agarilyticus]NLS11938.1 DUF342 domain-containing protein [Vibrio agarilyticus]
MWKYCLSWDDKHDNIIAKLPRDRKLSEPLKRRTLDAQLRAMDAEKLFLHEQDIIQFIEATLGEFPDAYEGIRIAQRLDAQIQVELSQADMLASITIVGSYGGNSVSGHDIVQALAQNQIKKGINKLALKKVLVKGNQLSAGQRFTQVVAAGKQPVNGEDARFIPLVEDITKRILRPQQSHENDGKVDMRNLGQTISVEEGQPVMRLEPATPGLAGFTVQGRVIAPKPGKDKSLKGGKGTEVSTTNPLLLVATKPGTPLIKHGVVEVDDALVMTEVSVATGHVSFNGDLLITGNIESGMVVKAAGSITVGGFIESANVQAKDDIIVGKGIIGHNVGEEDARSCVVQSNGSIVASYAQFAELSARKDIELQLHCMNNNLRCGGDLTVVDPQQRTGTLSGGTALVGGRVCCVSLGVEGDTATLVHGFYRYAGLKEKQQQLKDAYSQAQAETMAVIRKELELKKTPKSERDPNAQQEIDTLKAQNSEAVASAQAELEAFEAELERLLTVNTIEALKQVHTRVTVQFGDEKMIIKRATGAGNFVFNQYEIRANTAMKAEDITLEPH